MRGSEFPPSVDQYGFSFAILSPFSLIGRKKRAASATFSSRATPWSIAVVCFAASSDEVVR
jgi:hypothetical protein